MATPDPESNYDPANITDERAARRFHQIRHLSGSVGKLDSKIADAKQRLSALKEAREGLIAQLMAASRDEGELPLFADLD